MTSHVVARSTDLNASHPRGSQCSRTAYRPPDYLPPHHAPPRANPPTDICFEGRDHMSKSRFSAEAQDVFARYTIDEGALSRAYDDAFKRAFVQSRESDTREMGKEMEAILARARDGLDRLTQEFGGRFAASEEGLTEALGKARTQGETISALVREGERSLAVAETTSAERDALR